MVLQHRRAEMNPSECSRVTCVGIDDLRRDLELAKEELRRDLAVARKEVEIANQARQAQHDLFVAWQKLQNGTLATLTTAMAELQKTLNESIVKSNQVLWGLITGAALLLLNLVAKAL